MDAKREAIELFRQTGERNKIVHTCPFISLYIDDKTTFTTNGFSFNKKDFLKAYQTALKTICDAKDLRALDEKYILGFKLTGVTIKAVVFGCKTLYFTEIRRAYNLSLENSPECEQEREMLLIFKDGINPQD